jgi:hypothetical protein
MLNRVSKVAKNYFMVMRNSRHSISKRCIGASILMRLIHYEDIHKVLTLKERSHGRH